MAYSEPPLRNMVRLIVTSAYSIGSAPSELSMVSSTSARPSGGRPEVPAKMTSSILPPRSDLAPCSPITQASASTTLDLPEPLGPTMQVMPGSSCSVVEEAKDLNPFRVRLFRYNAVLLTIVGSGVDPSARHRPCQALKRGRMVAARRWGSSARLTLPGADPDPAKDGALSGPVSAAASGRGRVLVGVGDVGQLAPDQHHEHRRADEGEPERRGDAPLLGEQAADRRSRPPGRRRRRPG